MLAQSGVASWKDTTERIKLFSLPGHVYVNMNMSLLYTYVWRSLIEIYTWWPWPWKLCLHIHTHWKCFSLFLLLKVVVKMSETANMYHVMLVYYLMHQWHVVPSLLSFGFEFGPPTDFNPLGTTPADWPKRRRFRFLNQSDALLE